MQRQKSALIILTEQSANFDRGLKARYLYYYIMHQICQPGGFAHRRWYQIGGWP